MACVKMNNQSTKTFDINQGVRQGCVLSPLLFNLFLADLPNKLDSVQGKLKVDNIELNSLFWTDEFFLFSNNEEKPAEMIKVLEGLCEENKMTINNKNEMCNFQQIWSSRKAKVFLKWIRISKRTFVQVSRLRSNSVR